jgi:hypothetical protein
MGSLGAYVEAQADSVVPTTLTALDTLSTLNPTASVPDTSLLQVTPDATTSSTSTASTTVVSIYYLNVRGDEERGLPYTMFHRDSGSIIGVDDSATTFVVTGTMTDLRTSPSPIAESTSNSTTKTPRFSFTPSAFVNRTGIPSTITQGPTTFEYTGTQYGQDRTLVNRCKLDGMTSATCDLTHVGKGWYTRKHPGFSGTWSTYNYSWTSGDRFGFAPVTITAGLEKLAEQRPAKSTEGESGGSRLGSPLSGNYVPMSGTAVLISFIWGTLAVVLAG